MCQNFIFNLFLVCYHISNYNKKIKNIKKNNDLFISPTAAADYNERFRDMFTFSELILNIRKVGKIDSGKMQGQSLIRGVT